MPKKLFLSMERGIPSVQLPSVSKEKPDSEVPFCSRKCLVSETTKHLPILILVEISKPFLQFNAPGRSMLIKFSVPDERQKRRLFSMNA